MKSLFLNELYEGKNSATTKMPAAYYLGCLLPSFYLYLPFTEQLALSGFIEAKINRHKLSSISPLHLSNTKFRREISPGKSPFLPLLQQGYYTRHFSRKNRHKLSISPPIISNGTKFETGHLRGPAGQSFHLHKQR
jgi:hypothetical protein